MVVRDGKVTDEIHHLSADEEDNFRVAPGDIELDKERRIKLDLYQFVTVVNLQWVNQVKLTI